ncbi:MAG: hypothetical protein WAZ34_10220 [Rhodocyclaceae bacterium]
MPAFTDLTGLAGIALALSALCALGLARLPRARRGLAVLVLLLLLLLPIGDLPLAAYVRGIVGDPSIGTLLLLGYALARQSGFLAPLSASGRLAALALPLLAAGILYPLALGAAAYDSYRWGYGDPYFLGLLLVLAVAATWRLPLVALSIALAVLAWALGWHESGNLWDYLIDPLLVIYALFALPRALFALRRRAR